MSDNVKLNKFLWEEKNLIEQTKNYASKNETVTSDTMNDTKTNSIEKDWKNITHQSGIYKIVNRISGKYYVGSTTNFKQRWRTHKTQLNNNRHVNDYLQNAWNKYGPDAFEFIIIESNLTNLLEIEQRYLIIAENEQSKCYNLNFEASGGKLSEYSKQKIQGVNHPLYGKPVNEIRREKIKNSLKRYFQENPNRTVKKPRFSDEWKQKISKLHKDRLKDRTKITNFDHTIYTFVNKNTCESFTGVRRDFRAKYGLNPAALTCIMKGLTRKGWCLSN